MLSYSSSGGHALLAAAVFLAAAVAAPSLHAQDVAGADTVGAPIPAKLVTTGNQPLVPQPPKSLVHQDPPHGDYRVPEDPVPNGMPEPRGSESHDVAPPQPGPLATGQFRYFRNEIVAPGSLTTSDRTSEPSVSINRDTVFQTGNWYAALSRDNGESWTGVSPYTFFPAAAAGFCCDQRVIYVRSHDIVVWLLQYSANSSGNVYRFAVARGRDALRSNQASQWWYYDFTAQSFGYSSGSWLDYPDLAHDGTWLHCSANVFGGGSSASRSVRWRMELNDLRDRTGLSWTYSTESSLLGWNYRFAGGISGAAKMIWACHKDTNEMYVYELPEGSNSWVRSTRSVPSWSSATGNCPDPGGRNPCARAVGRVRGGAGSSTEAVFMWTAAQNGGSRPFPYTRVARFRVSDRTLIATHDINNSSYAYVYGTGYSNSLGHIGCVIGVVGGTQWPHTSAFVIDGYQAWNTGITTYSMGASNATISQDRYGDYFDVKRNWVDQRTFVGAGHTQSGGSGFSNSQPRYTWFGRDDYQPTWVNLSVQSSGVTSGVPITIDVEDRLGRQNGSTSFSRSYAPRQGYVLTAPATHTVGSAVYQFCNWALRVSPTGTFTERTAGERVLDVPDIGGADDTAVARYALRRTLTVRSDNPNSGVAITVSVPDLNRRQNGSTTFTRVYKDDDRLSLTAPANGATNRPFSHWTLNGIVQRGGRTLNLSMSRDHTAVAFFDTYRPGSYTPFGTGCPGTGGVVPIHDGIGTPDIGGTTQWRVRNAVANTGGVIYVGVRRAVPLPLNFIGMGTCTLDVDIAASLGIGINASGVAVLSAPIPNMPVLIGGSIDTQSAILDFGAPTPTKVVHTNGLRETIGGVF